MSTNRQVFIHTDWSSETKTYRSSLKKSWFKDHFYQIGSVGQFVRAYFFKQLQEQLIQTTIIFCKPEPSEKWATQVTGFPSFTRYLLKNMLHTIRCCKQVTSRLIHWYKFHFIYLFSGAHRASHFINASIMAALLIYWSLHLPQSCSTS